MFSVTPGRITVHAYLFTLLISQSLLMPSTVLANDVDAATAFLVSQQRADGSIATPVDIATPEQSTAEALLGMDESEAVRSAALAFLDALPPSGQPTEFLARRLTVSGTDAPLQELLSRQNADGGFAAGRGHASNVIDTAHALQALARQPSAPSLTVARATGYLLAGQGGDGSWQGEVFPTAAAMLALQPQRGKLSGVAAALTQATSYLLAVRDGAGWQETQLQALALTALATTGIDAALVEDDVDALMSLQLANGSWQNDAFVTALALRAVRAFEARRLGIDPNSNTGAIAGRVVRAGTGEPVAGARVYLAAAPDAAVTADSTGRFLFGSASSAVHTLVAEAPGLTPAALTVAVTPGEIVNAADLVLDVASDTAILAGFAQDGLSGAVIAQAQFALTGPTSATASTDAAGNVSFPAIAPGTYQLTVSAEGYRSETSTFSIVGGDVRQLRQLLLPSDAYSSNDPVSITLRAIDSTTGNPVPGATLIVDDRSAVADGDGVMRIDALAPGMYDAQLSAADYATSRLQFSLPPGVNGSLGDIGLQALDGPAAPSTLDLAINVISGLDGSAIAGATLQMIDTGQVYTTDAAGNVNINDLTVTEIALAATAGGFVPANFTVTASAFGAYAINLALSPTGGDPTRTASTLSGAITDRATGEPVEGALVNVSGTALESVTGADGRYLLDPIEATEFVIEISAAGYQAAQLQPQISTHGDYVLDIPLQPGIAPSGIQIVGVSVHGEPEPGVLSGTARVSNSGDAERAVQLAAEVIDIEGEPLGSVALIDPATGAPLAQTSLPAGATAAVTWQWHSGHVRSGAYSFVMRAVEPDSASSEFPLGIVLAEHIEPISLASRQRVVGQFVADPPVVQFGTTTPVELAALLVNDGNTDLRNEAFVLRVVDSETGEQHFEAQASLSALPIGGHQLLSFGEWLPGQAGDYDAIVAPVSPSMRGQVDGELYVGNKAGGQLTVTPDIVLPGDALVQASLLLQGVDVRDAASSDPLFFAVKEAVNKGADYVAPQAKSWHLRNRCLGCHIQTQSFVGLVNADEFEDEEPHAETTFLYNALTSSQHGDGEIWISHPHFDTTQTTLAAWALSEADTDGRLYASKYRAAQALHAHARRDSAGRTWWIPDHSSGWWNSYPATTYLAVKGLVDTLVRAERDENRNVLWGIERASLNTRGSNTRDLEAGPNGQYLYVVRYYGGVDRMDIATGEVTAAPQYTGSGNPFTVLPMPDGSLYVGGRNFVRHYLADGTESVLLSASGDYTDIIEAPGGGIYVVDRYRHRILHLQDDATYTVVSAGGLLNQPYGIELMDNGAIVVANYYGQNVLKIQADGTQQLFVDGVTERPLRIKRYGDGFLYTTWNGYLHYADGQGRVAKYAKHGHPGIAVSPAGVWLAHNVDDHIYRLLANDLDETQLAGFHADVQGALDWVLLDLNMNANDNIHQAVRLMVLAEALRVVDDPARVSAAEQRIAEIAATLRSRQRADGGWGRYVGWGSDAIVTALVGLALEYTHPSVDDPLVRNTILYLLGTQRSDGAWITSNRIIGGPPLAATSLVMAYMPKALERLGGIDIDVHMTFADNVVPGDVNLVPNEVTDDVELAHYRWSLTGVTSAGRQIDFPADMPAMRIGEQRPLAQAAWIEFRNSFNDDTVRVDLTVPTVKVVSGMAVTVATDGAKYGEHSPVAISGTVHNLKPLSEQGDVHLAVRAIGADAPLADLGMISAGTVPADDVVPFTTTWNTSSNLPGDLEIVATLFDGSGEVADTALAPFEIVRPPSAVGASIAADREIYGGFDPVALDNRVRNVTSTVMQREMRGVLSVVGPDGETVHSAVLDVPALAPNGHVDIPDGFVLQDASAGDYRALLVVQDAISRQTLAMAETTFQVERTSGDALSASTEVALPRVYRGEPNTCTDTITNRGGSDVSATLIRQLASMQNGAILSESSEPLQLAAQGTDLRSRGIVTHGFEIGGYVCLLLADFGAGPVQLSAATFGVLEPPIRIDAALAAGTRGRVLVLLDPACADSEPPEAGGLPCDDDPYGPEAAPPLPVQRAHIEAVLEATGWTYTIVTNAGDFETEFASGGYELFALFNEQVKLPEALQHDVVADIAKGRGLLVTGNHDRRNGRLEEALGIRSLGKNLDVERLVVEAFGEHAGGELDWLVAHAPNAIKIEGAETLGVYELQSQGKHVPGPEPGLTRNGHGQGTGIYMSYDSPLQSATEGDDGDHAALLAATLAAAHPQPYAPIAGRVFPLKLLLVNEGIATPGEIRLALPAGTTIVDGPASSTVSGGVVSWPFALEEEQQIEATVWLRLPEVAGPLALEAVIFAGEGDDLSEHARTTLVLDVQPQE